jgi:hypothetical protein
MHLAGNGPEATMSKPAVHTNLVAHDKALEAAGESIAPAPEVPAPTSIGHQAIRAADSVVGAVSVCSSCI